MKRHTTIFQLMLLIFFAVQTFGQQPLFSEFLYFSNLETSGGGPHTGSAVSFGGSDVMDGWVHSNDDLLMSSYGCPTFYGYVSTAGTAMMSSCSEAIFQGGFTEYADSIQTPPVFMLNYLRQAANYTFSADQLIGRPGIPDSLIMTKLHFTTEGVQVYQWSYQIPPIAGDDSPTNDYYFYHNHFVADTCRMDGFHHYDFPEPEDSSAYITWNTQISDTAAIIYIQGGQVQTYGQIQGQYLVITDKETPYLPADPEYHEDICYNNIWIIDDLIYADSDAESGEPLMGSPNRLGLVSGANIIYANTLANGAANGSEGQDLIINAALVTFEGSIVAHYWQNTLNDESMNGPNYSDPAESKGDGRGPINFGGTTGQDYRGYINLWGAMVQNKRGYMKRNNPGPYTSTIGYDKSYHYDPNLLTVAPPGFELLIAPLIGDLDLDGDLSVLDLVRLIELALQLGLPASQIEIYTADLDLNGLFNILDVVLLIERF
ncbi:MAG: hypothetical protein L3J79_02230 [Candidatus Marinimicrobia bacterium]|nr:hypothetical protein [Candidatus Neomarinimicrobiota bacterium]